MHRSSMYVYACVHHDQDERSVRTESLAAYHHDSTSKQGRQASFMQKWLAELRLQARVSDPVVTHLFPLFD